MKQIFESRLLYKKKITDNLIVVGFEADMEFEAGQFFHIIMDKDNPDDGNTGFRPYSILNSPKDSKSRKVIESYIKIIPGGLGSEYINSRNEGDKAWLRGPYGKFRLDRDSREHLFLCTGTGITPMHSMIEEHIDSGDEFTLIYSAKTKGALLYHERFKELESTHANFHYHPTLTKNGSDGWNGLTGRIHNHEELFGDLSQTTVYICGVKEFIMDMMEMVRGKAKNIIMERYT